jgi:predicted DNA-binding transcriptional regulator YafY
MRRADRLFQIIQILRRRRRPVTAAAIAAELERSLRTVYRDIADLMAQSVPIRGEAGIGYVLDRGFDMPPLMLTADEIEAAMLGAQWVMRRTDPDLARAAGDLIAKIGAVVPEHLRPLLVEPSLTSPQFAAVERPADRIDMAGVRVAIRGQRKIHLSYRDDQARATERVIWPIAVSYWEEARVIVGWCELRQAFRHFRTDRVAGARFLDERYPRPRVQLRAAWRKEVEAQLDGRFRKRAAAVFAE